MKVLNTVSDLQEVSPTVGQVTSTKGYTTAGDGGGATYLIKTAVDYAGTPDGYGDHSLANGNVAVLQTEGSVNARQFGATGDGSTDDTAALQAAVIAAKNGSLFIPAGAYRITSVIRVDTLVGFAANDTINIYGPGQTGGVGAGQNLATIKADGDIVAFTFTDAGGYKGSMANLTIENITNPYGGSSNVTYNSPNSVGIRVRDAFQMAFTNVAVERFGTGWLVDNEVAFTEGTTFLNCYAKWNKKGFKFKRNNGAATESFSHTSMVQCKCQIGRDSATGQWQDGLVVEGDGTNAASLYNGFLQLQIWTGDLTGGGTIGNMVKLANKGRIDKSSVFFTFEKIGNIDIGLDSFFSRCHTIMASLDLSHVNVVDANTTAGNRFRTSFIADVNINANAHSDSNWDNRGIQAAQVQGVHVDGGGAAGYGFIKGTGVNSPLMQCINGGGNGFFFQKLDPTTLEVGAVTVAKIDHTGKIYPGYGDGTSEVTNVSVGITQGSGAPASLTAGSLYLRNNTDWGTDATPLWAGRSGTGVFPMQAIHYRSARPSTPVLGQMMFDSLVGKPIWWDGTNWVDAAGATV